MAPITREQASNNGIFAVIPSAAGASGASGDTTGGVQGRQGSSRSTSTRVASMHRGRWICGASVRRSVESATASSGRRPRRRSATPCCPAWPRWRATTSSCAAPRRSCRSPATTSSTAQQSLQLTQQRAAGGVTTDLDVANASAQLRTTLAADPDAGAAGGSADQRAQPAAGPAAQRAASRPGRPRSRCPPVPPEVPVGLPSELARRRPDIRQAEAQLHAATADIGVATGRFLSVAEPDRQRRPAGAAAGPCVRSATRSSIRSGPA